ncbi:MAG: HAAS signaling domain-containing protein [Lysinibacillus sp.]
MNLIEVYIQEVIRRLPEKNRNDIALELKSTIEDMLPEGYNEENVETVLEKLGSPAALAEGYHDRSKYLIGPRYFDAYLSLLKMILPIAATVSLIALAAENIIGYEKHTSVLNMIILLIAEGVWGMIAVGIQVFFWLTVVFGIMERVNKSDDTRPLTPHLTEWKVEDLKDIQLVPKRKAISKYEVFGALIWTAIWATVYFYANHLVGIYKGGPEGLEFITPAMNEAELIHYWPIILLIIGLEISLSIYKLIERQWTKAMAWFNALLQIVVTVTFIVIIKNPYLFNPDFLTEMSRLFEVSVSKLELWIISGSILAFLIAAAINMFDGFRKASR